jgi:hypothetical protein
MTKKGLGLLLLSLFWGIETSRVAFGQGLAASDFPKAQLKIRAVDELNLPVDQALVEVTSIIQTDWNALPQLVEPEHRRTGPDGIASLTIHSAGGIMFEISKDNYYNARGRLDFQNKDGDWVTPPRPIITVLRQIEKPIPMYARVISIDVDTTEGERGIDLTDGTVGPRSPGKLQIIVSGSRLQPSGPTLHFDENLSFATAEDGIMPNGQEPSSIDFSVFRFPHSAPDIGYRQSITYFYDLVDGALKQSDKERPSRNGYIFKVSGHYGKIYGPIIMLPRVDAPSVYVNFTYTLSTQVGERSLEWDTQRNECTDAEWIATPLNP